jgi:transcriptional regulator with XRE-family HTH domain
MGLLKRFGTGLQKARKSRGLTQEDFSVISSRTYLSSLERGIKSPTISKVEELASVIGVHPLSLLALAYLPPQPEERNQLWAKIKADIESIDARVAIQEK